MKTVADGFKLLSTSKGCSGVLKSSEEFSVRKDSVLSSTLSSQEKSVRSSVKVSDAWAPTSTLVQDTGVLDTLVSSIHVRRRLLSTAVV